MIPSLFHALFPIVTLTPLILAIQFTQTIHREYCANYGAICPQHSPCCNEHDWCGSGPTFCGPGCQSTKSFMPSGSCLPPRKCRDLNRFQFTAQSIGTSIISLVNQSIDDNPNNNNNNNRPQSAAKVQFTLDAGALEVGASESGYLQMTLKRLDKRLDDGRWIGSGTRLSSISYLHYGRVSARLRMAAGAGVVTSFIIMSDGRDEIDFEWVGKDLTSVQTNYFYRGIIDYSRGRVHEIEGGDLSRDYHDYTIEWTPVYIRWLVDGRELRLVWRNSTLSDSAEYQFPSEPSRVQFGLWDGAAGAQGTREWAGETDWLSDKAKSKGYRADLQQVSIECLGGNIDDGPPTTSETTRGTYYYSIHNIALTMLFLFAACV